MALYDDFAIATFNEQSNMGTDALYRLYGAAFHAALTAAGMVQTSDTGQTDWTTPTRLAHSYTTSPYSVWRFNDALQATSPIFFRLSFGSHTTDDFFKVGIEIGTGSDGAGVITHRGAPTNAVLQGWLQITSSSTEVTSTATSYVIMPDKSTLFTCLSDVTSSASQGNFLIERFRNADGTPRDGGAVVIFAQSTMNMTCLLTDASPVFTQRTAATVPFACTGGPVPPLPLPWVDGTKTPYFPCATGNDGQRFGGFSLAGVATISTHVPFGTTFPATIYGQDVKCLALTKRLLSVAGATAWSNTGVTFNPVVEIVTGA